MDDNYFGFDPSLFQDKDEDKDGRKYKVSMVTDHQVAKKYAERLVLQEYDPVKKAMTRSVQDNSSITYKMSGWTTIIK